MAPILHRRAATGPPTWVVVVAVVAAVGVSALTCFGIYLLVFHFRDRQYREAARRDPYLTRKEWSRRRKLSALQRIEEEEVQRQLILRKTLTSRTSSRNDFGAPEGQRGQASVEVTRKESGERREDEDWKKWEAGHGGEVENDACEGHPLIQEHPAVKVGEQSRSASPTRIPLLKLQDPDSRRFSLWERRQNDNYTPSLRITSDSPSRAPELEHLHIFAPPPQLLHDPSPRHTRSVDHLHRLSPSERPRAASVDNRNHPIFRSANSFHTRAASNPVTIPLSEIPTSNRARSNSTSQPQLSDLVSPPPPAALPQSAPLRNDGSHPRDLDQRRASSHRERPLSWDLKKTTHTRTRSHEMLRCFRNASPSPAQSPRRKPVPNRGLSSVSSTGSLATTAASVPPTVSPVEEATLESERSTMPPDGGTLLSGDDFPVLRGEGIERLSVSDRDGLPSQMHQNLYLDPTAPAPLRRLHRTDTIHTANSVENPQLLIVESGNQPEELRTPLNNSPVQLEPSSNRLSVPVPTPAQTHHTDAGGHEEVGTAFSFEVGDQIKERNISVRQLEPQGSPPPDEELVVYGPENATIADTAGPPDTGTSFSFEIGDHLKELNISRRAPPQRDTPSPIDSLLSSSPQSPADHADASEQEEGTFDFEEESQLKELGISSRDPPPKRRASPLAQLDIPRSSVDQDGSSTGACLTPEDVARRLPVQGKWQLQVSMLDQTGARHWRGSRDGDSEYYSSASEPASPEDENTFDAEIPAPGAGDRFLAPVNTGEAQTLPMRPAPPRGVPHARTPSTPMTSPEMDASLCRANFASPAKEKMLSEKGLSPGSPPGSLPRFHSPSPITPPVQHAASPMSPPPNYTVSPTSPPIRTIPAFAPPRSTSEWSTSSEGLGVREGRRDTETVESDYGSDTMKQTFGSGAVPVATEKGQVSSRLSGPPDFMPAFF